MINNAYIIKNNDDWNNLKENEKLVDISNNSYFGYRAMEKKAQIIAYDPFIINNMIRMSKDSKKFLKTVHMLILDINTIGYLNEITNESFLKKATRKIQEIIEINPNIKLQFYIVNNNKIDEKVVLNLLEQIYKNG